MCLSVLYHSSVTFINNYLFAVPDHKTGSLVGVDFDSAALSAVAGFTPATCSPALPVTNFEVVLSLLLLVLT